MDLTGGSFCDQRAAGEKSRTLVFSIEEIQRSESLVVEFRSVYIVTSTDERDMCGRNQLIRVPGQSPTASRNFRTLDRPKELFSIKCTVAE